MRIKILLGLLRKVQIKTYEKGEVLIATGSMQKDLFFIKKGLIRSYREARGINEEPITFQLFPEYHMSGNVHSIFLNEPSKLTYEALERTTVYVIDFETYNEASKNPEFGEFSRMFMGKRLVKQAFQRVESFVFLTPEERYLKYTKENPNIINRAPDKYIANILGITPTSLSRIRKRISTKRS